jgi:AraC family transcriptional regulator
MNTALDYIEENLCGKIDMRLVAQKACCSEYHFTRFFSFIAGLPLSAYIRDRRMTLAGFALKNSNAKIVDIANMYGYDSPNSFSRAFIALHGVTPSEARNPGIPLKSFSRITFIISVKGDKELDYRIVEEGAHVVFGKAFVTNAANAYETIPAYWDSCEQNRTTNRIVEAGHGDEKTLLSAVYHSVDGADELLKYMICLEMPEGGVSDAFEIMTIPARKWAVFPLVINKPGDSIVSIWKRIYPE